MMLYMFIELIKYLMNSRISHNKYKLVRYFELLKKYIYIYYQGCMINRKHGEQRWLIWQTLEVWLWGMETLPASKLRESTRRSFAHDNFRSFSLVSTSVVCASSAISIWFVSVVFLLLLLFPFWKLPRCFGFIEALNSEMVILLLVILSHKKNLNKYSVESCVLVRS